MKRAPAFRWPLRPLGPIPGWIFTGTMTQARWGHSATLLPDGRVLVAGGIGVIDTLSSAEIYDPNTTNWTPTASMSEPRAFHTATALPGGDVLVTGGIGAAGIYSGPGTPPPPIAAISPRAQVYSPRSGTWHSISPMTTTRFEHTAELLPGGGVFVANGLGGPSDRTGPALVLDSGETFDPVTGEWTIASLGVFRYAATSALLSDGRVLLYGGLTIDANNQVTPAIVATVFNPATNAVDGALAVDPPRARHTATRVPDGSVLVVGGGTRGGSADNADSDTPEFADTLTDCVVDRAARSSTVVASLSQRRHRHTATLLPDGSVLIAGGVGAAGPDAHRSLADAWRYALPQGATAAVAGYWVAAGQLNDPRGAHTATLLDNGTVLVAGGADFATGTILDSAELFFLKLPNLTGCTWPAAGLMAAAAGMILERHFRQGRGQDG